MGMKFSNSVGRNEYNNNSIKWMGLKSDEGQSYLEVNGAQSQS